MKGSDFNRRKFIKGSTRRGGPGPVSRITQRNACFVRAFTQ